MNITRPQLELCTCGNCAECAQQAEDKRAADEAEASDSSSARKNRNSGVLCPGNGVRTMPV